MRCKRFWWIVVAFTIAGAVIGGLPAPEQAADSITRWTASNTMLVSSASSNGSIYTDPLAFNQLQLFATTGEVPKRVAEEIGYNGTPPALAAQITVVAEQQSGALRISTTQETADQAVLIADSFADQLVNYLAERQDSLQTRPSDGQPETAPGAGGPGHRRRSRRRARPPTTPSPNHSSTHCSASTAWPTSSTTRSNQPTRASWC